MLRKPEHKTCHDDIEDTKFIDQLSHEGESCVEVHGPHTDEEEDKKDQVRASTQSTSIVAI